MTSPQDQEIRDQIARDLSRSIYVEAGAGTGKTTSFVDRVVTLITSGDAGSGAEAMGSLAAITFTEKAAGELRDRIFEVLEKLAWSFPLRRAFRQPSV
ncbi:MAG: UvrD-helicase domain-containing protein [Actinobacteria bacterium]|nr:UvrD-helicase domain-containing protein [Actinomycetota bacterium]